VLLGEKSLLERSIKAEISPITTHKSSAGIVGEEIVTFFEPPEPAMMILSVILAVAATAVAAPTNSSTAIATSTVFDNGVPTDAPIPGDYTGKITWSPWFPFRGNFAEFCILRMFHGF
jgi:hypothetical protein